MQDNLLALAMSAHYAALDLELAVKTREQNKQKEKLEKELSSTQDPVCVFHGQLEKAAKSLTEMDDRISELTEEGTNQYTLGQTHARLDTLCQYYNGKLVDKEFDAEIL